MDQPVVFVIDDDESICRSLRRLIHSVGFQVRTFISGNDFLNQGCQNMPGCIVLDVRMPEIGGLELQNRLNDSGCKMPIIFMSAYQDTETREKAFHAGAIAFLQKPFEDQLLIEAIRSALNRCAEEPTETNHEEA
jgi:FixJ family two-component response regulator